ncbi:MAG TPA: 4-(cytidine 5'-diphospho)-2-C-methyl-D-erythritol kinase [Longimicrobiales bacterium]|nr:4-(cytidine 5'-diphospho)-2-C-methyl-D-erythritol kinase [Longimicrobiales bacterium]
MTDGGACAILAPAKVNLFLEVGGRREDGFHQIDTLFQAVSLWDRVRVERRGADVVLTVDGPDLGPAEKNLAVRAARLFLEEVGSREGVRLDLAKGIPAGAGLGGGSSDAAAVLRALNRLWGGCLPRGRLTELGSAVGSDVAFFLGTSPLARGTGRGELLEPLPPLPPADLVLVLPPVHVATGGAYAALTRSRAGVPTTFGASSRLPRGWADVASLARNDFQDVVAGIHPEVARSLEALRRAGGRPTLLSGSGAACFGVFPDEASARDAAARLRADLGWSATAVRTLAAFPAPGSLDAPGLEGVSPHG